jgi:hypothetical protein
MYCRIILILPFDHPLLAVTSAAPCFLRRECEHFERTALVKCARQFQTLIGTKSLNSPGLLVVFLVAVGIIVEALKQVAPKSLKKPL